MSGAAYITSMYISVMMVKCGEVHLVQPEDVDYLGHCSASARPRLISGPARSIAEVKTAITWLVQDPLKKALPELCLSKTLQEIADNFNTAMQHVLVIDGSGFDST